MRHSGKIASTVLAEAGAMVAPGVTTETIDLFVHERFIDVDARIDAHDVSDVAIDRRQVLEVVEAEGCRWPDGHRCCLNHRGRDDYFFNRFGRQRHAKFVCLPEGEENVGNRLAGVVGRR